MSNKFNYDEYLAGRRAGWQWAYRRLSLGIMTPAEVEKAADRPHPLLGYTSGMMEALHEFEEEQADKED